MPTEGKLPETAVQSRTEGSQPWSTSRLEVGARQSSFPPDSGWYAAELAGMQCIPSLLLVPTYPRVGAAGEGQLCTAAPPPLPNL